MTAPYILHFTIIRAGPAGLAAAIALKGSRIAVEIFEKSGSLCGRSASTYYHGTWLDTGANYLKSGSPEIEELLLKRLPTEALVRNDGTSGLLMAQET